MARRLVEQKLPGSVISVTSIEGVRAAPGYAAYAAAKAGVINYTKTAALELAPHGIRVNALAPDITLTEGHDAIAPPGADVRSGLMFRWGVAGPCRRDGRRGSISRVGDVQLRHRPDDPRRRRHAGAGGWYHHPETGELRLGPTSS